MRKPIGVPVVRPSYTPERISTASDSRRCVTWRELPGFLRSSSICRSAAEIASPGGHPSITPPYAGPCDSPNEVTQYRRPKLLPDIARRFYFEEAPCLEHRAGERPPGRPQMALEDEVEQQRVVLADLAQHRRGFARKQA